MSVQILLLAQAVGVLKLGNLSLDGSKIHADASKSKVVSYKERIFATVAQLGFLGPMASFLLVGPLVDPLLEPQAGQAAGVVLG